MSQQPTSRRPARPRLSACYRRGSGFLIRFPAMKFVGAVVLYLVIVLLTAYRTMLDEGMDEESAIGASFEVTIGCLAGVTF